MTIDGPNTPPDPPLPIVRPVVRILPRAIANSSVTADGGAVGSMACWIEP